MSVIVKFDDMYAASLSEHAIKKAKGKKLKVSYKRFMSESFRIESAGQHREMIDETLDEHNNQYESDLNIPKNERLS